ncbi:MAG: ERF family protein [Thermoplasmata archaeon]
MSKEKIATEGTTSSVPVSETTSEDFTIMLFNAIEKGLAVKSIEKIIQLRENLQKEISKREFFKSLTQFQKEVPVIQKDQVVLNKDGSVRYKYASLDKITETIKPFLTKYGLSYRFETHFEEKHIEIKCIITHIMGHSEVTSFKIPVDSSPNMSDIQKYGSSITYARRYALSLALGLTTDEDDDGNTQNHITLPDSKDINLKHNPDASEEFKPKNKPAASFTKPPTENQLNAIRNMAKRKGFDEEFIEAFISTIDTSAKASQIITAFGKGNYTELENFIAEITSAEEIEVPEEVTTQEPF